VLGLASRQFEAALSGAGVTKGGGRRERGAERERDKDKGPAKDGPPSGEKREGGGGGRKKEDDGLARGGPAEAPQPGVLPAPTILQREAKQHPPRPSQQPRRRTLRRAPCIDNDAHPPSYSNRGHGRRGRGRGRGGNRGGAPAPAADS